MYICEMIHTELQKMLTSVQDNSDKEARCGLLQQPKTITIFNFEKMAAKRKQSHKRGCVTLVQTNRLLVSHLTAMKIFNSI